MSDKKGKKGGRKSASATGGDSADGEFKSNEKSKMDEVTIEIYEAKVRDLVEKLERYKHKCEILTIENDTLGKAQSKTSNDKQDIVEFLNIKVTEHEKQISTLEDTVAQLNAERAAMDQKAQQELENALKAAHHETESLQSQCAVLKAQLNDLNTFAGRKDELEQQLKSLKAQLETKERTYKETILSIERKVLQDKNAVKKEMLQKVNEAVANFRRVADQQMAETTKRAIRENMAISSQLKKMSTKTLELIAENDTLKQKVAQLRTGNGLLNESEQELAKKNQTNQRVIRMLVEKLKESDKMLEIAYESGLLDVDGNVMYEDGEDQQQRPILLEESIAGAAYEQQLPREPDASVAGTEDVEESNGAQHPGNEMGHARSSVHFEDEHGHTSRARSVGEEEIEPIPTHMSAVVEAPENHLDYSPLSDLVLKLSSIADELIKSWDQTTPEEYGAALANHVDRLRVILEDVASMPAEQKFIPAGPLPQDSDSRIIKEPSDPSHMTHPLLNQSHAAQSHSHPSASHHESPVPQPPLKKTRPAGLHDVIAAIPSSRQVQHLLHTKGSVPADIPEDPFQHRAVQTQPMPTFNPTTKPEALLGEVRQWGAPAQSLPRKGLGLYVARRNTTPPVPPIPASGTSLSASFTPRGITPSGISLRIGTGEGDSHRALGPALRM